MLTALNKYKFFLFSILSIFLAAAYLVSLQDLKGLISQEKKYLEENELPKQVQVQGKEKIKYPHDFTIVLVGDSMTERLGNSTELREYLTKHYPGKSFEVLNYGFGSTNILSVPDRLTKSTIHLREYRPVLDIDYDLLILESFGHNPLSQFGLQEGLNKQQQTLDQIMKLLKEGHPEGKIVFLATIAPNKYRYATNQVDLSQQAREQWVSERKEYLKQHIQYAEKNNIPVINVYQKSLDQNGEGKLDYVDKQDNIHPSPQGILFISREIADFIFSNKIF